MNRLVVATAIAAVLTIWGAGTVAGTPPVALAAALALGAVSGLSLAAVWDRRWGG